MKWLIPFMFAAALYATIKVQCADTNAPKVFNAELVPTNTNAQIPLQSARVTPPLRLPVYVLPEVLEIQLPGGVRLMWIERHHLQELANKFRVIRYTNIVIYSDGI